MTTSVEKKVNGAPLASPEPRFDPRALAEAEAIRTEAAAKAEAIRTEAQGKADAERTLAAEQAKALALESEKQQLTLNRNQLRYQREEAEQRTKIAKADKEREDIERAREAARRQADEQQQAESMAAQAVAEADDRWRSYALNFYRVCAVVALPVQVAAFYNPKAIWLMGAPLMLEGGAWVVLKGAAAAVANRRPSWHYRLIAWLLAFIAAAINLWHGLNAFDPATAIGTAFASIAGPGVWDLHEHGRIRHRDGVPTRHERKAAEKEAKRLAAEKAEKELREAERQAYREKAEREAAEELDRTRAGEFPDVHRHAWRLVADYGKTAMTDAIWRQAKLDVEGAPPGESADVIRMRNAAEMRVEAARLKKPVGTLSKTTNAQRASQMPPTRKPRVYNPPARAGRRTRGDTPRYVSAARKQAAITAQQAAKNSRPSDN